jgi:hypothetical protein
VSICYAIRYSDGRIRPADRSTFHAAARTGQRLIRDRGQLAYRAGDAVAICYADRFGGAA